MQASQQGFEQPRRVLVIDDEEEVADTVRELLEREGLAVTVASDGADGLCAIAGGDYDVVLADLKMPRMNGAQLYARLAETRAEMLERLVFVTGDMLGHATGAFLAESGRPVVEKPFTRARLRSAIAALPSGRIAAH